MSSITVSIVLHESAEDIGSCLDALKSQSRQPDTIVVLDNASHDAGLAVAKRALPAIRDVRSEVNLGFAGGHNRAMALAPADIHIVLNPDCQLGRDFVRHVCAALDTHPEVGSVTGRLLRFRPSEPTGRQPLNEMADDVLDSTGMIALRNRRVLDRGTEEPACDRYQSPEYVFGATGAAAVYRRAMLDDVAVGGEIFDESFFAYREDVDLAWRAQLLNWRCLYLPAALARHRRRVAPGRRRQLPSSINRRSIANRWRMIAKNETMSGWRRDWHAILARDLITIGYCLFREPKSLVAIGDVIGARSRLRAWRQEIMLRRSASDAYVAEWFGRRAAEPIPVASET